MDAILILLFFLMLMAPCIVALRGRWLEHAEDKAANRPVMAVAPSILSAEPVAGPVRQISPAAVKIAEAIRAASPVVTASPDGRVVESEVQIRAEPSAVERLEGLLERAAVEAMMAREAALRADAAAQEANAAAAEVRAEMASQAAALARQDAMHALDEARAAQQAYDAMVSWQDEPVRLVQPKRAA